MSAEARGRPRTPPIRVTSPPEGAAETRHWQRGQALIELALVLPLIFVFLLILVDFGIALDHREVIQHAVREGARRAAIGAEVASVQQYTVDESEGILGAANVTVCYIDLNGNGNPGNPGDDVRVSATYTYRFTAGGGEMLTIFGVPVPSIDMTPSADMRLEASVAGATACP